MKTKLSAEQVLYFIHAVLKRARSNHCADALTRIRVILSQGGHGEKGAIRTLIGPDLSFTLHGKSVFVDVPLRMFEDMKDQNPDGKEALDILAMHCVWDAVRYLEHKTRMSSTVIKGLTQPKVICFIISTEMNVEVSGPLNNEFGSVMRYQLSLATDIVREAN